MGLKKIEVTDQINMDKMKNLSHIEEVEETKTENSKTEKSYLLRFTEEKRKAYKKFCIDNNIDLKTLFLMSADFLIRNVNEEKWVLDSNGVYIK